MTTEAREAYLAGISEEEKRIRREIKARQNCIKRAKMGFKGKLLNDYIRECKLIIKALKRRLPMYKLQYIQKNDRMGYIGYCYKCKYKRYKMSCPVGYNGDEWILYCPRTGQKLR